MHTAAELIPQVLADFQSALTSMPSPKPPEPHDPLAPPGLMRFLLGKTASEMLAAAGSHHILQAYPSPRPEDAGRFVMLALPVTKDVADQCARVAKGTHRATKFKSANP